MEISNIVVYVLLFNMSTASMQAIYKSARRGKRLSEGGTCSYDDVAYRHR